MYDPARRGAIFLALCASDGDYGDCHADLQYASERHAAGKGGRKLSRQGVRCHEYDHDVDDAAWHADLWTDRRFCGDRVALDRDRNCHVSGRLHPDT